MLRFGAVNELQAVNCEHLSCSLAHWFPACVVSVHTMYDHHSALPRLLGPCCCCLHLCVLASRHRLTPKNELITVSLQQSLTLILKK
jgi:hypothetical protein